MANSRIIVWDVGHGSSVSILAPNGRTGMLDLGANTETEFSPIKFTKSMWRLDRLNHLTISHPHIDHIRDILNLRLLELDTLNALEIPKEQLFAERIQEKDRDLLNAYVQLKQRFSGPITALKDPNNPSWGGQGYFSHYSIKADWQSEPNNASIVTFYRSGKFTLLYPGDIESRGWNELLKSKEFVNDLKSTAFFIASHHGREAGFSKEIVETAAPQLVIVSDSWFKDTSVTDRYSHLATGFEVINDNTGTKEKRSVVSTRADGRVIIDVSDLGNKTTANVRVKKTLS
ncbi:hypothetical protein E6H34_00385 [Candidatus Bathyarchaeota archaeon]|nr:MAG: hypothetical protein E6H34_00385 [Candidatus Bathyarchaeota archaeon]